MMVSIFCCVLIRCALIALLSKIIKLLYFLNIIGFLMHKPNPRLALRSFHLG